jgi:DNA mismatch endonuclease Vsr
MAKQSPRPDFSDASPARRRNMAAIKGSDTKPELVVRRAAHALGYRYRLHARDLPGRPDIVFPRLRKIIEIRGCFWHRHPGCAKAATPATRQEFWQAKFADTIGRDARNDAALRAAGWSVLVLWECEINNPALGNRLRAFLGRRPNPSIVTAESADLALLGTK